MAAPIGQQPQGQPQIFFGGANPQIAVRRIVNPNNNANNDVIQQHPGAQNQSQDSRGIWVEDDEGFPQFVPRITIRRIVNANNVRNEPLPDAQNQPPRNASERPNCCMSFLYWVVFICTFGFCDLFPKKMNVARQQFLNFLRNQNADPILIQSIETLNNNGLKFILRQLVGLENHLRNELRAHPTSEESETQVGIFKVIRRATNNDHLQQRFMVISTGLNNDLCGRGDTQVALHSWNFMMTGWVLSYLNDLFLGCSSTPVDRGRAILFGNCVGVIEEPRWHGDSNTVIRTATGEYPLDTVWRIDAETGRCIPAQHQNN